MDSPSSFLVQYIFAIFRLFDRYTAYFSDHNHCENVGIRLQTHNQ